MTNFKSIKHVDRQRLYKVYHIRKIGCEDTSEGYIGITKNSLKFRLSQHMTSKRPVGQILRELGKDSVEIVKLAELPFDEACQMEYNLRPKLRMGWNYMVGGAQAAPEWYKHKVGFDARFQPGQLPHNCGTGKRVRLTSPEGGVFEPEVLEAFCAEHGLVRQNVHKVCKGQRKHTKGWTAVYIS